MSLDVEGDVFEGNEEVHGQCSSQGLETKCSHSISTGLARMKNLPIYSGKNTKRLTFVEYKNE